MSKKTAKGNFGPFAGGEHAASGSQDSPNAVAGRVRANNARPHGIEGVPTHTVGRASERRGYARARLELTLHIQRIAGRREMNPVPLRTLDISSTGVFFLSPYLIEPGTPVELEVLLVNRPTGRGTVRMQTAGHIVRVETKDAGWHGLAANFDDICFQRDESIPAR